VRRLGSVGVWAVACVATLGGCATDFLPSSSEQTESEPAVVQVAAQKHVPEPHLLAKQGIAALESGDLAAASRMVNTALQRQITDSRLQLLNGFVYHQMAERGDQSKLPLAEQGYNLVIRFDPTNWQAHYQLGLLNLDRRDFAAAQSNLAEAAFYKPDDPDVLYNLAMASYYNQDPETAAGALARLREVPGYATDGSVLQASSLVMAALGHPDRAEAFLSLYRQQNGDGRTADFIEARVGDWQRFHRHAAKVVPAQLLVDQPETRRQSVSPAASGGTTPDENQMVIVDVVIIRTEESNTTSKGVNLLNGLKLQFGIPTSTTNALEYTRTYSRTRGALTQSLVSRMTVPSVEYSLNIFNANNTRNEILARPTLVALNGEPSEFFSGVEINAAAVSGGDGEAVNIDKEIGVKLTITPQVLEDDQIKMAVQAQRTFLTTPNTTSVNFTFRIDTSKTQVNANVVMDFGETLILSGMSEKETERTRDGVPGLQDTPVVQYLFSKAGTTDFQKSVLILITPRPPEFINRSARNLARDQERRLRGESPVLNELRARYSDWFKPYPNWASVFHHMQDNSLYREFRTGDVSLEVWRSQEKRSGRVNQILDFLYF